MTHFSFICFLLQVAIKKQQKMCFNFLIVTLYAFILHKANKLTTFSTQCTYIHPISVQTWYLLYIFKSNNTSSFTDPEEEGKRKINSLRSTYICTYWMINFKWNCINLIVATLQVLLYRNSISRFTSWAWGHIQARITL